MPNTIKVVINDVNRMSRTISELEARIAELNEQIATQEITISEQAEQIAQLNAQIISLNAEIAQLNVTITSLNAEIAQLNVTITSLNAQITSLSEQVSSLQATITSLNAQISALNAGIENVNGETVENPLEYLSETKSQILQALQSKGSSATSSTTFREYASEISQLNKKGDIHTKLLLQFNGDNPEESSLYDNNITYSSGFSRSTTVKKFGDYSMKVTGDSYVTLNRCNEIPLWDYTIEFWINIESSSTTTYTAMANCLNSTLSTSNYYIYMFGCYTDTSKYTYRVNNTYSHDIPRTSITNNEWHHIAYCRKNNYKYTFLDGTLVESHYNTKYAMVWTGENFVIGGSTVGSVSGQYSVYYLDQFRISDVCRYTANFTPPTEPFTI